MRNALDQAQREIATRYDFKGTDSGIEESGEGLTLRSSSDDRLRALRQVIEEKFVRRKLSLKALDWGKTEEASGQQVRQAVVFRSGIPSEAAKDINTRIKKMGRKGLQSQTQGDAVRVTSKKRDDLQAVMADLRSADLDRPLQFTNLRD